MFTRIVVPLDGSTAAEQAIPYARELAQATDTPMESISILHQFARHQALDGRGAHAIVEHLHGTGDELVVMACCPHSVLHDAITPNPANLVVASGRAPVLVIDPRASTSAAHGRPRLLGRHLVVPVDGSDFAAAAVPVAAELASALMGTLVVLDVVPLVVTPVNSALWVPESVEWSWWRTDVELEAAKASVASLTHQVRAQYPDVRVSTDVEIGDVAGQVERIADVGMVVMATHARTGLSRLLLGSQPDEVFARDHVPVLLVHPQPTPGGTRRTLPARDDVSAARRNGTALTRTSPESWRRRPWRQG